jgi:hypothetical protein
MVLVVRFSNGCLLSSKYEIPITTLQLCCVVCSYVMSGASSLHAHEQQPDKQRKVAGKCCGVVQEVKDLIESLKHFRKDWKQGCSNLNMMMGGNGVLDWLLPRWGPLPGLLVGDKQESPVKHEWQISSSCQYSSCDCNIQILDLMRWSGVDSVPYVIEMCCYMAT